MATHLAPHLGHAQRPLSVDLSHPTIDYIHLMLIQATSPLIQAALAIVRVTRLLAMVALVCPMREEGRSAMEC